MRILISRIKSMLILIIASSLFFNGVVRHKCIKVKDINNDNIGIIHKRKHSLEENGMVLLLFFNKVCDIKNVMIKYSNLLDYSHYESNVMYINFGIKMHTYI